MKTKKTEVGKLIDALKTSAKSKEELEPYLNHKTVVKNLVNIARGKGYKIALVNKKYQLES